MKFSYRKLQLSRKSDYFGSAILKPLIPLKICVGKSDINYTALIDSGADFCIFDAEIGEYLGLDIFAGPKEVFGGIQEKGGAEAFIHNVILEIGGWGYKTKVGFSYDIAKHGFGILGQKGFFDIFVVKFDLSKENIELKEKRS